ncbi:diguanylate cyclase domain-containing protein [Pilimelia columellifera]
MVVARQLVAFADNARLLAKVDDSLAELQRHERRLSSLLRHSSDITTVIDAAGCFSYVSPAVTRVLGYRVEELVGQQSTTFLHPEDRAEVQSQLREANATPGATVTYQARYRHADGSWSWLEVITTNLLDQPDVAGMVSNSREVTEARQLQERLRHQAQHDPLTQLANRALFTERLQAATRQRRHDDGTVTVLVIDLDDFKSINDTLGHHAGDTALIAVADRLQGSIRATDTAARLGGDEFAVLLPQTTAGEATLVAQRFITALERPVTVDGQRLRLQCSIGVAALSSDDDTDPDVLLRRGDSAMYVAKQQGKGRFVVHSAEAPTDRAAPA